MNKMKNITCLTTILTILIFVQIVNSSYAWASNTYYVQETETPPAIDGILTENEWQTNEDVFSETITDLFYIHGSIDQISIEIVILRDDSSIYLLIKILTDLSETPGNISIGIALAEKEILSMKDSMDRKVVFHNNMHENITTTYDLFNCELTSSCTTTRSLLPGLNDGNDVTSVFGIYENINFFEIMFPLISDEKVKDLEVTDGTNIKILVNPYANLIEQDNGHGGKSTSNLVLKFSPQNRQSSLSYDIILSVFALSCVLLCFHFKRRVYK